MRSASHGKNNTGKLPVFRTLWPSPSGARAFMRSAAEACIVEFTAWRSALARSSARGLCSPGRKRWRPRIVRMLPVPRASRARK